ncbi:MULTISPECIES: hypothetical protein [Klebsiella]|jgi:hypothetical protein|uniref:hypothetical protein n=1 Tax=Klebsiella TaxID=570 RepID=UPI00049F4414|nr:hypothetical protein [Klebsiella aerogenes]EKV7121305.1 hypothetical protein [Klebsiella aerogenes]EKZ9889760.1 hypothetical protein [Klebsiella aerogenes]ELA2173603.1 hypothetical protein [Klebsiella aerogenes]ELA2475177.1 hypothetical protein [Klebsiella aerogenes]KDF23027.1 hypothetical protein AF48_01336 [Klebsiella aerogenes MGH 62]
MTGLQLTGVIFALVVAWIFFACKEYAAKAPPKKTKKQKDDEAWIEEINTGFDEWFNELKARK